MKRPTLPCVSGVIGILISVAIVAPSAVAAPASAPATTQAASNDEWVVYATEVGWLRIGPRSEYESKWAQKDEINGGTSDKPLKKILLAPGFDTRDDALQDVCNHLRNVQLRIVPPTAGGPARYLTGDYREKQYSLRLTKGFDADTATLMAKTGKFYKALEYDWESEWNVLADHHITPRQVFSSRQWLMHFTGHGSVNGPVKEDRWGCSSARPLENEKHESFVVLADGMGGTITYSIKEVEGPFVENYSMATAMKKYKVSKVDLWPPVTSAVGRDVQPTVEADKIPAKPKDYGDAALPMQELQPDKALEDWVVYAVEDKWLHVGTRYEYGLPLLKNEVIWAGTTTAPAKKTILLPLESSKEIFHSRQQALRAMVGELTEIGYRFTPQADPHETITAKFRGTLYNLHIERGDAGDLVLVGPKGINYDVGGNIATLRLVDPNITPKKIFQKQWLVHATGHGTMDGTVKDDRWMVLNTQPGPKNFTIPDGMGGTFGYSYDKGAGPFSDSYALIEYLKGIAKTDPHVKSIGLYGENRGVSVDDIPDGVQPIDYGQPREAPGITLRQVIPKSAHQGDSLGIMLLGSKIETGCRISLGQGVTVKNPAYFGVDPVSKEDQWIATVDINDDAETGSRTMTVYNAQASYGTLPDAFEILERTDNLCPPLQLVVPAGGSAWIFAQTSEDAANAIADPNEKARQLTQIKNRRNRLQDALHQLPELRDQHLSKWHELEQVVKDLQDARSEKRFDVNVRLLKQRADLERQIRQLEADYIKSASPLLESFTLAEELVLSNSLSRRAACLYKATAAALDDAREYNYTVYWDDFAQKKLYYDILREDLIHTLNGYQAINSMRLGRSLRLLGVERTHLAVSGALAAGNNALLKSLQRRLRDIYLDMGNVSLMLAQAQAEAVMLDQESYFAGVWAVNKQNKNIELSNNFKEQSAQAVIFSMKYLLSGGQSLIGVGVDGVKRVVNFLASPVSDVPTFDTVSSEIGKQIKESRQKTNQGLATLKRIRDLSDADSANLLQAASDAGVDYFNSNRIFQEQTSGGLRRLAACYVTDLPQLMNEELLMAGEHAAMSAADMDKAFNARVGANASGNIPWSKVLTDPLGTARVAIQDKPSGGNQFTPTIEYIAQRKAQVQEMEAVRAALQKVNFDLVALHNALPRAYANYLELENDNPDFLQWTLTHQRLAAQARLDVIEQELGNVFDPDQRLVLQQMAARNRSMIMFEALDKQARIYQLQGTDKLMVWDYDGALECFYQAAEWNPKIQPLDRVEALRKALAWQKTVESGMDVAAQVGNMGVQAALFEFLGQSVGQALEVPGAEAAIGATPLSVSGFAEFVWKQFNPFADLVKAGIVEQELKKIGEATAGLATVVGTQIVQVDIVKKGILHGYFGVDDQWADFLSNALVTTSQVKLAKGNSVMAEAASWLKHINDSFDFRIVDIPGFNERQMARRSVSDYYEYLEWTQAAKQERERVVQEKLDALNVEQLKTVTQPAVEAQQHVEDTLEPLTKTRLQSLYDQCFPAEGPALDPQQRLVQIRKFFGHMKWKQQLMELKIPKGDPLSRKVDGLRREVLAMSQTEFFNDSRYAKYKDYVVDYLYIGSAGKKTSKAYKELDSDIDFTLLVKEETPESVRNELRDDFMKFFVDFGGKELEGFEMSIMVDPMPDFNATGESVQGIIGAIVSEPDPQKRAENRNALRAGITKTLEQLVRNASDKERYLDRGNLFRHNVFVRLGCFLKKAQIERTAEGAELVDEPASKYDELYGNVPLEPWMAFDAVVGNMGYIFQHALEHPNDAVAYQKVLSGKYAIRGALYSLLLLSPKARQRLSTLSRAEVEQNGWEGSERIVVEVAKDILSQPGGMAELGLPTTLTEPGSNQPIAMTAQAWAKLFDEWNYRKEGLPLGEVFGKPRGLKLDNDSRMVGRLLAENIVKTEACFKAALRKSIMDQGTELMNLRNARNDALKANDADAAQIFELKMKEIMLSQAAVWNRMSREQQNLALKELPPEADWWLAIAATEQLKQTASQPAATPDNPDRVVLNADAARNWQPKVFLDKPSDEIAKEILELQHRAKTAAPPKVMNQAPQPAND